MPLFVVGRENTLEALDRRLFETGVSPSAVERIRQAIRDANPGVDFGDLRPGLVLELPPAPELRVSTDLAVVQPVAEGVGALREQLSAELEDLGIVAQERLREDAAARRVLAEMLDSRVVQAIASQDETVTAALKSAQEGVAEDDAAEEARQALVKQAVAEWTEELAALDRLLF